MNDLLFVIKVWLCVWPLVTIISVVMRALPWHLPLAIQTMAISGLLVPLMSYVILPFLRAPSKPTQGADL